MNQWVTGPAKDGKGSNGLRKAFSLLCVGITYAAAGNFLMACTIQLQRSLQNLYTC